MTVPSPDAVAQAREEDILWYAAVTAEKIAQAVRDSIKDKPGDWDAATIAKVDYVYKTARECRVRYRKAVERRVRAECAAKVRERAEMMSPYNRQWVEQILAILEAQP